MSVTADTAVGTEKTSHTGEEEWRGEGRRHDGKQRRESVLPGQLGNHPEMYSLHFF